MTTTQQETPGLTVGSPQQAVSLLIQGVQVAQQRGAYQLNEASLLSEAVSFLTGTPPEATSLTSKPAEAEKTEEVEADDAPTSTEDETTES